MSILCGECGCNCVRGHVLDRCANTECCCAVLPMRSINTIAEEVRHAMATVDLVAMERLLAPEARWASPDQDVPTCRNARQILSWYEVARDNGVRAVITEVVIEGQNIVVALAIVASATPSVKSQDHERCQVLSVEDGLVTEIRGYETRHEAVAYATSGVSHWKS